MNCEPATIATVKDDRFSLEEGLVALRCADLRANQMGQDRDIAEKLHALVGARAGADSEAEVSAPSSPFLLVHRAALEALRRGVEGERGSRIEESEVRIWVVASERRNDRLGGSDDFDGGIGACPTGVAPED